MMRTRLLPGLAALALAGCAGGATTPPEAPPQGPIPIGAIPHEETIHEGTVYGGTSTPVRGPSSGDWAVSIVGTPFLLVFRSVVCVSSVVIAAPFSAMLALADAPEGLEVLGDGVTQNCAGPYVLRPGDVS
jgi:hypothetical protein